MNATPPRRTSRAQLVLIMAIGLASLAAAYVVFYVMRGDTPWGTTNQGEFVEPPLTVAQLGLTGDGGTPFETGGTWWLWVVPQGACADDCRYALHQLRQLHVLLNRDASRVRRALVTRAGGADRGLQQQYPNLAPLVGNVAPLTRGIYIVDPNGNLVLHYPLRDAGKPVLDDLKRLLQVSQIG